MAQQVTNNGFAAKIGNRLDNAIKAHNKDETKYGFQRLPGGINNGIAKLQKAYFDIYDSGDNKGNFYLRMEGVVQEPEFAIDPETQVIMKVRGLTTSVMVPICTTKNAEGKVTSEEDNIAIALNHWRMLGFDTGNLKNGADLEKMAAFIMSKGPYFKFSTSQAKASIDPKTKKPRPPRVFENWHGSQGLEHFLPNPKANVTGVTAAPTTTPTGTPVNGVGHTATVAEAPPPVEEPVAELDIDQQDMATIIELAKGEGPSSIPARKRLEDMARAAGKTDQDILDAESWDVVAEWGTTGPAQDESSTSESAEDAPAYNFKVGEVYGYYPIDGKTKKPGKVKVDCMITAIDTKAETVDLKNMEDKKKNYKAVKWTALESATTAE